MYYSIAVAVFVVFVIIGVASARDTQPCFRVLVITLYSIVGLLISVGAYFHQGFYAIACGVAALSITIVLAFIRFFGEKRN